VNQVIAAGTVLKDMTGIVALGWQEVDVAAVAGCVITLLLCLALIATRCWHGRFTDDRLAGVQKFHKVPTPRIGGLAIGLAYALLWPAVPDGLQAAWLLIGIAGLPALGAGLIEDVTGRVGVRHRLLATMAAGVLFAVLTGYAMRDVDLPGVNLALSFTLVALLFTGFCMGGVANAINIIDGFNGLAAGSLLIMFGTFAFVAHQVNDDLVFGLAVLYGALVMGFFLVNFPLGKIFLGDGGAYFAGFLLASLGVLLPSRNPEISAWTAILICAYPVIETLASMLRKARRNGHSVGQPDRVHFHMLAYRRYARRIIPRRSAAHLRNPAASVATWPLPLLSAGFAMLAWQSALASAFFFFVTVFVYGQLYRVMSLNAPRLPLGLARLL
jgi:UDP-N-acetylmuramyl pentapeptide phosphotransferase/UDP-N-acetylglucosamine-1-phosphate transferase